MELAPRRWLISPWGSAAVPSESAAQHRLFEMVAHDPAAAKRTGIKASVAKDFVAADKGRDLKSLPQHVEKKSMGGPVPCAAYPRAFDW